MDISWFGGLSHMDAVSVCSLSLHDCCWGVGFAGRSIRDEYADETYASYWSLSKYCACFWMNQFEFDEIIFCRKKAIGKMLFFMLYLSNYSMHSMWMVRLFFHHQQSKLNGGLHHMHTYNVHYMSKYCWSSNNIPTYTIVHMAHIAIAKASQGRT